MANNTYVLIHGSWRGKFCWAKVVAMLEAMGHTALTIDLPAHGDDTTPPEHTSIPLSFFLHARSTDGLLN